MASKSTTKKSAPRKPKLTLQQQAELHSNDPENNKDPLHAPPVESSGPDNHAQNFDQAVRMAEPLRGEVAASYADRGENAGQHMADANVVHEDPDKLIAKRDRATARAEKAQADEARKVLAGLKGDAATVPTERKDVPETAVRLENIAGGDAELAEHLIQFSAPSAGSLQIGDLVSRQDIAHDELGVVTEIDNSNINHPLVKVEWKTEGESWLTPSNLVIESSKHE